MFRKHYQYVFLPAAKFTTYDSFGPIIFVCMILDLEMLKCLFGMTVKLQEAFKKLLLEEYYILGYNAM
jgi:hypothetical protein